MKNIFLALVVLAIATPSRAEDYTVSINDKALILGITLAREAYNDALPRDEKGAVVGEITDDGAYLQMVIESAARSYAKQYGADVTKIDSDIAGLQAQKAEILKRAK